MTRDEEERAIAKAMKRLNRKNREELYKLLGKPPSLERVPDSFWKNMEEEEAATLFLLLAAVYMRSTGMVAQQTSVNFSKESAAAAAKEYARNRSSRIASNHVQGVRRSVESTLRRNMFGRVKTRAASFHAGTELVDEELITDTVTHKDLESILSNESAENMAITENTAASSAGQRAVGNAAKKAGLEVQVIWMTEEDGLVCPICAPLHQTEERFWRDRFPEGPPAHPRCRCDLVTVVNGQQGSRFLPDIGTNPISFDPIMGGLIG